MSNLGLSECYKKKIITHLILNAWEKTHEFSLRTCAGKKSKSNVEINHRIDWSILHEMTNMVNRFNNNNN